MSDWLRLRGRSFTTIQGAPFTVVNTTRGSVIVQPASTHHRYGIPIAELEKLLADYVRGTFLPSPAYLARAGVPPERSSYVWGILHAVLVEGGMPAPSAGDEVAISPEPSGRGQLLKVDSSMLYALGYDPTERALEVVFWNGPIWRYEDVAPEEYEALLAAKSIGSRMREIIETHPGRQLRGPGK